MPSATRLLVASNRLPFTVQNEDGELKLQPSCGGLAAALGAVHERRQNVWIGWPGDCETLDAAQRAQLASSLRGQRVVPVSVSRTESVPYYDGVCNSVLWPVFHYLLDCLPVAFPDFRMYRAINERFAAAIVDEYQTGDVIWIHDYHLLLAPAMVRLQLPDARIGFFLHTPFPAAEVFRVLPWRRELLDGLLGSTLLGFQTPRDTRNFLDTVATLTEYQVDGDCVIAGGREVRAGAYPIGIDRLRLWTTDDGGRRTQGRVALSGRRLLLGIDRLDYTKGIPRRLAAFERLLEDNPQLHGEVELLQVAVPSRGHVPSYAALRQQVEGLVSSINQRFATGDWTPVRYLGQPLDPGELAEVYRAADVMLVTSVRDGMNLVAKEFVLARTDEDGVLILSELAGAADELTEALLINPYSVEDLSSAMSAALTMDRRERQRRMAALRRRVDAQTVEDWADRFTVDLLQPAARSVPAETVLSAVHTSIASDADVNLVLPYEGVIVPDSEYAEALRPDSESLDLLRALDARAGVSVHVLTKCDHDLAGRWFDGVPVTLWAEHGLWKRERDSRRWRRTQWISNGWVTDVRELFEQFATRIPGAFIEERGTSLFWNHGRADRLQGRTEAQMLAALLRDAGDALGFIVFETATAVEVRPAGLTLERTVRKVLNGRTAAGRALLFDPPGEHALRGALAPRDMIVTVGAAAPSGGLSVEDFRAARTLLRQLATFGLSAVSTDTIAESSHVASTQQVAML